MLARHLGSHAGGDDHHVLAAGHNFGRSFLKRLHGFASNIGSEPVPLREPSSEAVGHLVHVRADFQVRCAGIAGPTAPKAADMHAGLFLTQSLTRSRSEKTSKIRFCRLSSLRFAVLKDARGVYGFAGGAIAKLVTDWALAGTPKPGHQIHV